jgi:hypothetical protein
VKLFACDNCQQTLYFENNRCVACGSALAYRPEVAQLATLKPGDRLCRNALEHEACNWLVTSGGDSDFCKSCELSSVIPDLSDQANEQAWRRIEAAKRRLLYGLYGLELPVEKRSPGSESGLEFRFLKGTEAEPVMTGHLEGVITLNVDEADFAFRENMREKMGEGYRTVLGHLRHEVGHYYWDRLLRDHPARLESFRQIFGDERADYEKAVERHYEQGPPANWGETFISAYASMHPWEDWAETWAHYLHITDTLETAKSHGLTLRAPAADNPATRIATAGVEFGDFEQLSSGWNALTLALNSLNRSMGMKDAYPFVLSPQVLGKLRFVHGLIQQQRAEKAARPLAAIA